MKGGTAIKRFICTILTVLLCFACIAPANAAPIESELTYLDEEKDIVIWVEWDTEKPSVVFLSADGTEYDPSVVSENTATIENGNSLYYIIKNAPRGQWTVRLDKGRNNTVEISVHDYHAGVYIKSFGIGTVSGDELPVTFLLGGDENRRVNYRISAVIDRSGAEKELRTGYAKVGEERNETVRLNSLSTYDAYMLKLYVWYDDNGADIFDFAFSEVFAYTNASADEKRTDFSLTVEPDSQLLTVAWEDLGYSAESVLVAVFEDDAAEPTLFDEYEPEEAPIVLSYDPACDKVAVELTVKYNGVNTAPTRKTAVLSDEMPICLPEGNLFNSLQLPLTYQDLHQQAVAVSVNEKSTSLVLDGSGTVNLALLDDWNSVQVDYTDANGITWRISRQIFIDRIAPILNLHRSYDGMHLIEKSITVSGTVIDFSRLLINGSEISVGANGTFSHSIELVDGQNILNVVAVDGAGNESRYTAKITCDSATVGAISMDGETESPDSWYYAFLDSYWVLLGCSVLCLLVVGYALIFWRKDKNKDKE